MNSSHTIESPITDHMGATSKAVKRLSDIVCSSLAMAILSPLFLVIGILLKLQGNGPVFFCQERIGKEGRPFTIYKFRTMSSEIEEAGPRLISPTEAVNATCLENALRQYHLDELPQFWNVLKGDMSIVGPRPERRFFIEKIEKQDPRYEFIYLMHPGLISEATIFNGYTDTMEKMLKRLEMDLDYLQHRTLLADAKIVATALKKIITGKKF